MYALVILIRITTHHNDNILHLQAIDTHLQTQNIRNNGKLFHIQGKIRKSSLTPHTISNIMKVNWTIFSISKVNYVFSFEDRVSLTVKLGVASATFHAHI